MTQGRVCKLCEVRFFKSGRGQFCSVKCAILGKIEKKDNGCWIWLAAKSGDGYGAIKVNGVQKSVHRQAYEEFVGEIHEKSLVCHKCDTPLCCNPDHLFLGTPGDNTKDSVKKSRARVTRQIGSKNTNTRLDEITVSMIKKLYANGFQMPHIQKLTNIPKKTLEGIIYNITWKHVKVGEET